MKLAGRCTDVAVKATPALPRTDLAQSLAASRRLWSSRKAIGVGPPEIIVRMIAFCLVVVGAAPIPAPVRATAAATDAPGARGLWRRRGHLNRADLFAEG